MKYTKYFALINQHHGLHRLSTLELGRVFNIVHVEGRIRECEELIDEIKSFNSGPIKYARSQRLRTLSALTGDKSPSALLKEMHMHSEDS